MHTQKHFLQFTVFPMTYIYTGLYWILAQRTPLSFTSHSLESLPHAPRYPRSTLVLVPRRPERADRARRADDHAHPWQARGRQPSPVHDRTRARRRENKSPPSGGLRAVGVCAVLERVIFEGRARTSRFWERGEPEAPGARGEGECLACCWMLRMTLMWTL